MKANRIKHLSLMLIVVAVFSGTGIFLTRDRGDDFRAHTQNPSVKETYEQSVTEDEKYLLTVRDGKLMAYRVNGTDKKLISSGDINLQLMSEEEVRILSDGIYADSFEELCLYFEAYAS